MTTTVRQRRRPAVAPPTRKATRRTVPGWVIAAAGVLGALVIAAVALLGGRDSASPAAPAPLSPPPTSVVAEIDGRSIPVREFALYLAQERAATFTHFRKEYGAVDGPRFWTTRHSGTTPADYLKQRALSDAKKTTVVLNLAHEYGLLADPSYSGFLRDWTAENQRRSAAVATGQVIYGPKQYTEANYLTYVLHNLAFDLKQKLAKKGVLKVTESALRRYYDTHKNDLRQAEETGAPLTTPSYAQARAQVRQMYLDDRYEDLVADAARSAQVHAFSAVLAAVPVA
ncbi:hypothetical protein [Streptomyces fuscichromogenes]|uniref:Uncharacterized protein n=1 Tax=Streptomyces fuscichromogenes TaxID=1324013 RepID=A0A918CTP2_9ACTN|nr:hypothetical protein [Streptomyces fuscichromogenes]GGN22508.1 hypothetical protein GCM10011578_054290 [Streptomyces fuscichromogenes]